MSKPTYEELEKRVKELEKEVIEYKKAEEALRESEKRYINLLENANDLILSVDASGSFGYVNRKLLETLEYSKEELKGLKLTDILRKDQIPKCMGLFKRACGGESLENIETVFITKEGHEIYTEGNANPQIKEGKFATTVCIFRDITERKRSEEERNKILHNMTERIKELNCLYSLSKLIEKPDISLEDIYKETVNIIPPSWQYPEITCVRIVFNGREFITANFKETKWKQSAKIVTSGEKIGSVEVYYLEEKPVIDEGPFLKEERSLIDALGRQLGNTIERKKLEKERIKRSNLETINKLIVTLNHEMNQPLSVIIAYADAIMDDAEKESQLYKDVKLIHDEAWRISKLVKKISKLKEIKTTDYIQGIKMLDLSENDNEENNEIEKDG